MSKKTTPTGQAGHLSLKRRGVIGVVLSTGHPSSADSTGSFLMGEKLKIPPNSRRFPHCAKTPSVLSHPAEPESTNLNIIIVFRISENKRLLVVAGKAGHSAAERVLNYESRGSHE